MDLTAEFEGYIEKMLDCNKKNLQAFEQLNRFRNKEGAYVIWALQSWSFKDLTLSFFFSSEEFQVLSFSSFFKDVPNIFGATLPSTEYFDLTETIKKYDILDPRKNSVMDWIKKWSLCLHQIHQSLVVLNEMVVTKQKNTVQILKPFNIDAFDAKLIQRKALPKKEGLKNLQFELECSDKTMSLISQFQSIILDQFSIAEPIQIGWELQGSSVISTSSVVRSLATAAWAATGEISNRIELDLPIRINHGTTNGWAQIGIASSDLDEFPDPGCTISSNKFTFCYHLWKGTVNNLPNCSKLSHPKSFPKFTIPETRVVLHLSRGSVKFSVNGELQNGEWTLPDWFRIFVDIYHPGTEATLL